MKIYTNLYKKLLLFFLIIFTFHDIRVEEELPEECAQEECEDIDPFEGVTRGINNKDIASFCALLAKQTVHQIIGGNLENNLTLISNRIDEIEIIINNLSIVAQLGLINTSVASPALTTTLIILNNNVDAYNNDIELALVAIAAAIITPSITNTTTARALLSIAINDFNNIIVDYNMKSVMSMYSLAEIYSALAQLNAQLGYLYILQSA